MEIRKMSPSELEKAIKEELERVGGYDAWRRNGYANKRVSNPLQPQLSGTAQQYADACKWVAEIRGVSLEELFKREPERYKQYCRIVLEE